ncbi:MFS general substrate transporter [Echria macrotheca]|uniref:MFS general substrate transporter n=1 Tax=Echria macrotheca TaxID=438768 RepID=A0AAJ0B485_9PEZI|nr:MFS general substrate transporter [Echria macrotheca]
MARIKTIIIPPKLAAPLPPRSLGERIHEVAFIFILCLAQFLSLAAMNQTVAPMLILAEYFDIRDYGNLSWFSAAYSMTVGTFILPAGRLGDIYGHKRIFLAGWAWFATWSLIAGFCTPTQLIWFSACRALQGIGPALTIPTAIALIGQTFPVGLRRNLAFACFGASGPTGAALGAVMAALVAQTASWHWCFYILAAVCALLIPISYILIPSPTPTFPRKGDPIPKFDVPGAVTGVVGLVLVNFALNQAPLVDWSTPYVPALFVAGVVSLAVFVWVELRVAEQPIIPLRGLQRNAAFTLACVFAGWSSHGIWVYYLYIFLEHLRGHSALLTSAETSPVAVTGIFFAFLTVWMLRRIPVSWVMFFAMGFFTLGGILMAVAPLEQPYWGNVFVAVVLMPGAMNLSFPAATILLSEALPREKQGIAASLVATVVNYSISCGLGFAGSIHKSALLSASRKAGMAVDGGQPPPPLSETSSELVAVRLIGLRYAYWFAVALGGLGMLIAAMFILVQKAEERRKRRDLEKGGIGEDGSPRGSVAGVTTFYMGDKIIRVLDGSKS